MKLLLLICSLFCVLPSYSQQGTKLSFEDTFQSYSNGSDGSPDWMPVKGTWQMIDGKYVQQQSDYDCISLLGKYISGSFVFSVTFTQIDGDLGAGIAFSSYRNDNTDFAQLVRYDGGTTFLMGYYQNGEFNGTASTKTESLDLKKEHMLTVVGDGEKETFTTLIDGSVIMNNVPMHYHSGYIGLQSSGGRVSFSHVSLTWTPEERHSFAIDWVKHFIVMPDGSFMLPDERDGYLQMVDGKGTTLKNIGSSSVKKGFFHHPSSLALLGKSSLAVADEGNNTIQLLSLDGKWINSVGGKGTDPGKFINPSGITTNLQNQIFVADKGNNRIEVFDDSLRFITAFGSNRLREPQDISVEDSLIYVVNAGISQVDIWSWNGKKALWRKFISYGGGECRGIAVRHGKIYLSVVNDVREYDTTGTLLNTFKGRSINFIFPYGISIDAKGDIYIADFSGGRIVRTNESLSDPVPVVTFRNSTTTIGWDGIDDPSSDVNVLNGDHPGNVPAHNNGTHHQVRFDNLIPSTNYEYSITPPLAVIPASAQRSRKFSFITPAGSKTKEFVRLPMLAIIFQNVKDNKNVKPGISAQPALPDSEVNRIEAQIRDGIRFYWIKSGMNFFIDVDFLVVSKTIDRAKLYGEEWWYPPRDSAIEATLRENNRDIKNYSSLLYMTCTQIWDTTLHKYVLGGKGGAFTNGVGTGKGYGISYWDVTRRNHNAGNNWLMVHEFNHQLDDIFMVSGYPEYWFNHISPTIGTAAKFGEHFDANAYIISMVPREEWFDLQYTKLMTARDADEDGIPDNDPRLPLDEVRLGSDSTKIDSDGDGISDLQELSFSNWLTEGWGETYGTPIFPNLHSRDADQDGLSDGIDPLPCSRIVPSLSMNVLTQFCMLRNEKMNGAISGTWTNDSLIFVYQMDRNVPVKLMIDANTDGWFCGRDNYLITCKPDSTENAETKVQIFNGTDPHQWPFMDAALSDAIKIQASIKHEEDRYLFRLAIPRNDSLSLNLKNGKKIGIVTGFLVPFDNDGNKRYLDLFEPNKFFELTLQK